jgi:hypothetical protein
MTLNPQPNYPSKRSYVLKIHRDAAPGLGQVFGRLEHMETGECIDFVSGEAMLRALAAHLGRLEAAPAPDAS